MNINCILHGWNKGFFCAILGIQHPAVLYEPNQCRMRNVEQSVFLMQYYYTADTALNLKAEVQQHRDFIVQQVR